VIVRRAVAGKAITEADRGHFHHQLIFRFGLNTRQAVFLIYAVCLLLGAVALAFSGTFTHVFRHAIYNGPVAHAPLRVMTVFGTRPDTIKMAPVVRALEGNP